MLKFADLTILGQLGQGSFSSVYQTDKGALKVLRHSNSKYITHFHVKEIVFLKQLRHCQGVVRLQRVIVHGGQIGLLTQKHQMSLRRRLTNGRMGLDQVRYLFVKLVQAVSQIHSHSIIHRDLKPQNILLSGSSLKICDFGSATRLLFDPDCHSTAHSTLAYSSPQMLTQQKYGSSSDVWALGCILFEMIRGEGPLFKGQSKEQIVLWSKSRRWEKQGEEELLDRLLRFDQRQRPKARQIIPLINKLL